MIKFTMTACYFSFILIVFVASVTGRSLYDSHSELVLDGTDDPSKERNTSFLHLKGTGVVEEQCEQMYGFLPCSETLLGHIFLIVVYEYLLYHGESYVSTGGKRIFQILGPGIFGASAFQVLGFLPESFILLVSGLSNTKDVAQEYVLTGVGLLAGSSILVLTLIWGTCVIVGSRKFTSESDLSTPLLNSTQNRYQNMLSFFTGCGVVTDHETSYAAKIMVVSVIPFMFLLIPELFFGSFQGYMFMIPLFVSFIFLIVYFIYQVFEPSIQKRRLAYVKHEHLVVDIINHLQEHTAEQVLTEDGSPNLPAIRRLFTKIDQDGDNYISFPELKQLLQDIKFREINWSKDKKMDEIMKEFDTDGNSKVTIDEFVERFTKWLDEMKDAVNKRSYRSTRSWKELIQIIQPWVQTKKKEEEMMRVLISEIIRHAQTFPLGNFYYEDGTTNVSAIKRLFEKIDLNKDQFVTQSELKRLIMDINTVKIPEDIDKLTDKIMQDLDTSGDNQIDEHEFINGFKEWLNTSNYQIDPISPGANSTDRPWEKWIDDGVDRSNWAWTKAIMMLVLGITMLALLAEPLIHSVQNVSSSANIPSFFVSFIFVPFATNARAAISAIKTASKKNERTTSLTFSELYDGVFMNNVLGFFVLLAVIYFRGLAWEFSEEVLVVLIACVIMGSAASFRSKFPIWTSFIAYLLYPLSLILVIVLNRF
ncbi:sodium/calcium exchanger NCL2-like [Rutidosis leptorrhynchoides]|uniref:sodium/calcium exchanger NCL2-like n=1 Tax=Rutidosis leptorrhynchoides TaxID=125765 RepID=UPI003A9A34EB